MRALQYRFPMLGVLIVLGGCGGGGDSAIPPPPPANASPGGVWTGVDAISATPVLGLVAETGDLFFSAEGPTTQGVYYVGKFVTDGNAINANVDAVTAPFSIYPDRATSGTGTLGGQIAARMSITGSVSINTDAATSIVGGQDFSTPVSVTFSNQYNRPSSLATIAGNYGPGSLALSISGSGVLSARDAGTGCVISGTVGTIDTNYNMYAVSLTTVGCATEFNVPDGAQLKGLATLNDSQSPEYVIIGAADTIGPTKSALMITMNRT
ncbi:MAG TPA: hypothetical protein VMT29_16435 [Steroidobacteraceae bacterium]|nr:hypothetical protein [Steroidobacteraceae bacterium]